MTSDPSFLGAIDRWLRAALEDRPRTFSTLVRRLPGVDPILVLHRLSSASFQENPLAAAIVRNAQTPHADSSIPHRAPVPHPLDYDWRYGSKALATLTQMIERLVPRGGRVVLIGAPTLVKPLLRRSNGYRISLVDRNPFWRDQFAEVDVQTLDVSTDDCPESVRASADLVVIDPPWYDDGYAAFVWFARQSLRRAGKLAVSVLPVGTRPSAAKDRGHLERLVKGYGFSLVERHASILDYATPPFEVNAMRAAGIHAKLEQWRVGDLWLYSEDSKGSSQARPASVSGRDWHELSFNEVRIKFDANAATGSAQLRSIIPGDVLPSVSARFPGRDRATVWTSGNRVFASANSAALFDLCRAASWDPVDGFTAANLSGEERTLLAFVEGIVELERREYGKSAV